jgi:inorganic pyrophosphatase
MVHPWHEVPNDPDRCADEATAIIEVPRGCGIKYELDKETGLLRVDRVLYSSVVFPANYGFFPRSLGEDGDPLDVLVVGGEAVVPLALLRVRPIGLMRMEDGGKCDDKVVAVHRDDPSVAQVREMDDLPGHTLRQLRRFFEDYKILEGKRVEVGEFDGRGEALKTLRGALARYQEWEARGRGGASRVTMTDEPFPAPPGRKGGAARRARKR